MTLRQVFLRSSFGLGINASQADVLEYAESLASGLRRPADVDFAGLRGGESGMMSCIFDTGDAVCGYRVMLDGRLFGDGCVSRGALDMAYVRSIVAAGHEVEHIREIEDGSREMAVCRIADCCNEWNYRCNYKHNRREIRAENAGLRSAQEYLREKADHGLCDRLLLEYVNGMTDGHCDYWISRPAGKPFKSMDDVFAAFDRAYDDAAKHVSRYTAKVPKGCKDAFAVVTGIGSGKGISKDWMFAYNALQAADDAYGSNLILASVGLHVYPGMAREAPCADLPDLSTKAVFGHDASAAGKTVLERLAEINAETDRRWAEVHGPDGPEY